MDTIKIDIPITYMVEIALSAQDPLPIEIQGYAKSKLYETGNYDILLKRQKEKLNSIVEDIRRFAGDKAANDVLETLEQNKKIYEDIERGFLSQASPNDKDKSE